MIDIQDKHLCSGCTACKAICPKSCICMVEDEMGFKYPRVDTSKCINCNLCEKVYPFHNTWSPINDHPYLLAMQSNDIELIMSTSSGGVFSALAIDILKKGGVVYGAVYDSIWNVQHTRITSLEDLSRLKGSKYVQSDLGDVLRGVLSDLNVGLIVLFSGTPCQIAGLKHFLRRDYSNLICIEVICHGVPSPKAWQSYLSEIPFSVTYVNMRERSNESGYSLCLKGQDESKNEYKLTEHLSSNIYLRGFLENLYLRPSCFKCKTKGLRSHSDMSLGDFWTIRKFSKNWSDTPEMVLLNTPKGISLIEQVKGFQKETIEYASINQIGNYVNKNASFNSKSQIFFERISYTSFSQLVSFLLKKSFKEKIVLYLRNAIISPIIAIRNLLR